MKNNNTHLLLVIFAMLAFGPIGAQTTNTHGSGKQAPPSDVHLTKEQAEVVKAIEAKHDSH